MTVKELVNNTFGIHEFYVVENALEKVLDIDENIKVKELLEIMKKPIDK